MTIIDVILTATPEEWSSALNHGTRSVILVPVEVPDAVAEKFKSYSIEEKLDLGKRLLAYGFLKAMECVMQEVDYASE